MTAAADGRVHLRLIQQRYAASVKTIQTSADERPAALRFVVRALSPLYRILGHALAPLARSAVSRPALSAFLRVSARFAARRKSPLDREMIERFGGEFEVIRNRTEPGSPTCPSRAREGV